MRSEVRALSRPLLCSLTHATSNGWLLCCRPTPKNKRNADRLRGDPRQLAVRVKGLATRPAAFGPNNCFEESKAPTGVESSHRHKVNAGAGETERRSSPYRKSVWQAPDSPGGEDQISRIASRGQARLQVPHPRHITGDGSGISKAASCFSSPLGQARTAAHSPSIQCSGWHLL